MSKVFISYRRTDTQMAAGRLRESLSKRFGDEAIFRDKDSIVGGKDWIEAIEHNLGAKGVVVLMLIGPTWLTAQDEAGRRRLDDPEDWNRIEIEHALRNGRTLVPVLIDNTPMPSASQLPESLKAIGRTNAVKLRDDDWDADVAKLERVLATHGIPVPGGAPMSRPTPASRHLIIAGSFALTLALAGAGAWLFTSLGDSKDSLSGSWALTQFYEDNSRHGGTLTLEHRGQTLTGTLAWAQKGAPRAISGGQVNGSTIEFEASGPRGARRVYQGELDDARNLIQGSARGGSSTASIWNAVRQSGRP
ncbi:MAG: toll/interleukin-1 receptor domain-containing protein [Burkholderiales bacterium]